MSRQRFLVPGPVKPRSLAQLDERQSRQVRSVLRLSKGDEIVVFDGSGAEAMAALTEVNRSGATYEIQSITYPRREPELELTVGMALLRGERFELALQKLTELGVRRIVPLSADHCVAVIRDSRDWDRKAERFRRIIAEALEQSERVIAVELSAPASLAEFMARYPTLALVERGQHESLAGVDIRDTMAVAVGPEGGWSDSELALIDEMAETASLGRLILRAETAAIVAAGTLIQRSYLEND